MLWGAGRTYPIILILFHVFLLWTSQSSAYIEAHLLTGPKISANNVKYYASNRTERPIRHMAIRHYFPVERVTFFKSIRSIASTENSIFFYWYSSMLHINQKLSEMWQELPLNLSWRTIDSQPQFIKELGILLLDKGEKLWVPLT